MRSGIGQFAPARRCQQFAIGAVGAPGDGDSEPVAQRRCDLVLHRGVPAADEYRRHGLHLRVEPGRDAPFDTADKGFGGGQVLLAREQQRDVHRYAGENRLLDRGDAGGGARNLDEKIGPLRAPVQPGGGLDGAGGVIGQQRRDLERYKAVDAAGGVVHRPEQVRRLRQVLQRQFEEQLLARLAGGGFVVDGIVIKIGFLDRLVENGGVGRQSSHRILGDIARQRTAGQQSARDVVEPQALTQIVQLLRGLHDQLLAGNGQCHPVTPSA